MKALAQLSKRRLHSYFWNWNAIAKTYQARRSKLAKHVAMTSHRSQLSAFNACVTYVDMEHDLRLARAKAHTMGRALDYDVMRVAMVHWIELLHRGRADRRRMQKVMMLGLSFA